MKNSKIYDVAIIGAGPSGTGVANTLLESKLKLIIIDKAKFPRNKPCAGVLPPRIYSELDIPENIQERPLEGYRLFGSSGVIIESNFPKPGLIVNRATFDEFLVNKLGFNIIQDHISDLRENDDYIEVKGKSESYRSKIVVGADGVNSIVRRKLDIPLPTLAIAAQYEISIPKEEIDDRIGNWFEVYYTIPFGYGWLSPQKNSVKVGVGGVSEELRKNTKKCLDKFVERPEIQEKITGGDIQNFELHRIPMGGPVERLTANRSILVGDAGGFVYPGTGEGIYYAIKSGRLAGEVILQALEERQFDQQFLDQLYTEKLAANGLLSLRDVDFIENVLATKEKTERYLQKLKKLSQN